MIQGLFLTAELKCYPSILELARNIVHIQTCYLNAYPYLFIINSCWIILFYFVNMPFIISRMLGFILCYPLFSLSISHRQIYYLKHLMQVIGRSDYTGLSVPSPIIHLVTSQVKILWNEETEDVKQPQSAGRHHGRRTDTELTTRQLYSLLPGENDWNRKI